MQYNTDRFIPDIVESRNLPSFGTEIRPVSGPSDLRRIDKLTVVYEQDKVSNAVVKQLKNCGVNELVLNTDSKRDY
jgi:hypothetical protein